jgi:transposase
VPPVKHCCAWLGVAPPNAISGGRVWRARPLNVVSRATQACRHAAHSVARSGASCGASFRVLQARLGPPHATVALAHQIARVVSHRLKYREPFTTESAAEDERTRCDRELKHLTRRAHTLGYALTPVK